MVVWEDGKMNKSAYRKFKVKTVAGVDDFASMREVVERRYRRIRDDAAARSRSRGANGRKSKSGFERARLQSCRSDERRRRSGL